MIGEELSSEEKKLLRDYDAKYKLVRYLVIEKQKYDGVDMVDFQFTPGNEFLSMPIIDLVNSILTSFKGAKELLDFAVFFMRWIRKHLELIDNSKKADVDIV